MNSTVVHKMSGEERRRKRNATYYKNHTVERRAVCEHCSYEPKDHLWPRLKARVGNHKFTCCDVCRGVQSWSA